MQNTSILQEVGEAIEKISTFRCFLKLLKLFLGPYIFIKQSKNWGSTVLFTSYGAPHYRHFIQNTSILQEAGEAIEKISTFRCFLKLLKLFLGPYIFIKQSKNWGSTVLFTSYGAPHYRHFIQNTSILQEAGEAIKKNLHIQIFLKLVEIVIRTLFFHKKNKKTVVNRFVLS